MFDLLELIESYFHLIFSFKHCNKTDLCCSFVVIEPDVVNQSYLLSFVTTSKHALYVLLTVLTSVSLLTDPRKVDLANKTSNGAEPPKQPGHRWKTLFLQVADCPHGRGKDLKCKIVFAWKHDVCTSGWWFQICFIFTPNLGEDSQFD